MLLRISRMKQFSLPKFLIYQAVYVEWQKAALYGTSWNVLQNNQNILAEELQSNKSKTFSSKTPRAMKKAPAEAAPSFHSTVSVSNIKVPVFSFKSQQNQTHMKHLKVCQGPSEHIKRPNSKTDVSSNLSFLSSFAYPPFLLKNKTNKKVRGTRSLLWEWKKLQSKTHFPIQFGLWKNFCMASLVQGELTQGGHIGKRFLFW